MTNAPTARHPTSLPSRVSAPRAPLDAETIPCGGGQLVSGESRGTDRATVFEDCPQGANTDPTVEGKLAALDWWISYPGGEGGASHERTTKAEAPLPAGKGRD